MEVDPLASMRCWPITVTIADREFEIPALTAGDWWSALSSMTDMPNQVLDLLQSESDSDLDSLLLDGTVSGEELGEAVRDVVEVATGRSVYAASVIIFVANSHWPVIGGTLAREGFRWDVQPISAALDAVYSIIMEGMSGDKNKDSREKFLRILNDERTPDGKRKQPDREKVMAEFEAMAGPRPAPTRRKSTDEQSGSERPRTRPQRQRRPPGARSGAPTTPP